VKSELGKGAVFTLYLTAAEKDTVKMVKPGKTIPAGKGKILLMDDEESILQSIGMLLRKLGYTVETTRNGYEAVERYREALQKRTPFDLCIMDLTVPGSMGGCEARERIAALDPGVRAIVSSGYSDDPIMSEHAKYGFIGVLIKPYHLDELASLLHEILDS
jgi:two-component system, cell cycle sensor histidine kinase and response regulator CckA